MSNHSELSLVQSNKQKRSSRKLGSTTESDVIEAKNRLFELKAQGVITDDEESRRNALIMNYMEYRRSEEDEEQSITMSYVLSTVKGAFFDCFAQTARMFYSDH